MDDDILRARFGAAACVARITDEAKRVDGKIRYGGIAGAGARSPVACAWVDGGSITHSRLSRRCTGHTPRPHTGTILTWASARRYIKGRAEKVTIFDTQRDLTARQDVHTRCPCTHSTTIGRYHSCEAHKPCLWPRDMAINEHQLAESSIDAALCAGAHALSALL